MVTVPTENRSIHAQVRAVNTVSGEHAVYGEADRRAHAMRLVIMANELLALAAEMEGYVTEPTALHPGTTRPHRLLDDTCATELARAHYRDRRLRAQLFDDQALFGEPAWDMLLDLFIAARDHKQVPVTSACIGASVPTTTALRWLTILESRGLVVRENDIADARRVFVRLSADAHAKMLEYFRRSSQGPKLASTRFSGANDRANLAGEAERTFILG